MKLGHLEFSKEIKVWRSSVKNKCWYGCYKSKRAFGVFQCHPNNRVWAVSTSAHSLSFGMHKIIIEFTMVVISKTQRQSDMGDEMVGGVNILGGKGGGWDIYDRNSNSNISGSSFLSSRPLRA